MSESMVSRSSPIPFLLSSNCRRRSDIQLVFGHTFGRAKVIRTICRPSSCQVQTIGQVRNGADRIVLRWPKIERWDPESGRDDQSEATT